MTSAAVATGWCRQLKGFCRSFQPHHRIEFPGQFTDCRGQHIPTPGAPVAKNAALNTNQRPPDRLGRGLPLLNAGAPGKMAHAQQRHEGDGKMGPDPTLGPVEDRPHPQAAGTGSPSASCADSERTARPATSENVRFANATSRLSLSTRLRGYPILWERDIEHHEALLNLAVMRPSP